MDLTGCAQVFLRTSLLSSFLSITNAVKSLHRARRDTTLPDDKVFVDFQINYGML
jgi:hypothetical protein